MITYRGFSTVARNKPPFTVTDIELVKIDLLNHFSTRRGERVMTPTFGSIIPDIVMEPLDAISKDQILADVKSIIAQDPRVKLINTPVLTDLDYTIRIEVELFFILQKTADFLYLDFTTNREA